VQHLSDRSELIFRSLIPFFGENCIQFAMGTEGIERRKQYDKAFYPDKILRYISIIEKVGKTNLEYIENQNFTIKSIEHMCHLMSIKAILEICFLPQEQSDQIHENMLILYKRIFNHLEKSLVGDELSSGLTKEMEVQFQKDKSEFYAIIQQVINDRLPVLEDVHSDDQKLMLIDQIILFHGEANREIIENELMVYLIGGSHTSGNLLAWCLYYLSKNPDCQKKLFEEISASKLQFSNTFECLKNVSSLKYLRCCINETLRVSHLAPFAARLVEEEMYLQSYKIPANTPIIFALGVALHDEKIFRDNEKFIPERFLDNTLPSFSFTPFGFAGKRRCPGERFSYLEISMWLIQLVGNYHFSLSDPNQVVTKSYGLVTHIAEEVAVVFKKR